MSSRQDHPNNAAGVPMIFPVWLENFQIKYINPALRPLSKKLPGFSVIKHRGRKSGKEFETIVTSYRKGDVLAIGLAHGKTNWVKNVLAAGEADIHVARRDLHLVNPRILPAGTSDPSLPRIAQIVAKRSGVFVADIAH
ncbi:MULTISPECIES: nitroreductase family deazaflavin-dependent oxidoreductase [Mycobacteriaceae]|uniref:Nitroreductase family deazaflavin-dependent oxidoreductase n=1 Tax=Mycolicibacterium mucogenicum DSM 44124 TaxID=1226753 RepID=A0A8H2JD81_MYCMU|nr:MULTISPECIES: nitroreductase family deazaflavin-dependent oxidoreductase [Mycobacteriaceae]KAB7753088.1 nitroreductase [Mycolicibacterium mucogenicum DSM 44124]QPG67288.1 nitroreductase family deazaflavin-dependent oxidoreductase [Mycolicibacterium mucogenicum DSM 44124]SEB15339.1 deazaflavin-dependent oxidoreductase, nitroreductase family [Mycobacterium sp. 283mftsu]